MIWEHSKILSASIDPVCACRLHTQFTAKAENPLKDGPLGHTRWCLVCQGFFPYRIKKTPKSFFLVHASLILLCVFRFLFYSNLFIWFFFAVTETAICRRGQIIRFSQSHCSYLENNSKYSFTLQLIIIVSGNLSY